MAADDPTPKRPVSKRTRRFRKGRPLKPLVPRVPAEIRPDDKKAQA